jgi:hypothetical protein
MNFDSAWIIDTNKSRFDGRVESKKFFKIDLNSGYGPKEYRSGLRKWEVTSAAEDKMEVKLTFINEFYVGTGPIRCEI